MRTMMTRRLRLSLPVGAVLLALGCAGDGSDGGDALDLDPAWGEFGQGDWPAATEAFLTAVAQAPANAEAWCGLGWSRASWQATGEAPGDLSEGVLGAFREADRLRPGYVDAWAGLAEFHSVRGDTLAALNWALDAAGEGGADYIFAHRGEVSHRSLRKIAAWQYFKLERYAEAAAQVRTVVPGFQYAGRPDSLEVLLAGIGSL